LEPIVKANTKTRLFLKTKPGNKLFGPPLHSWEKFKEVSLGLLNPLPTKWVLRPKKFQGNGFFKGPQNKLSPR